MISEGRGGRGENKHGKEEEGREKKGKRKRGRERAHKQDVVDENNYYNKKLLKVFGENRGKVRREMGAGRGGSEVEWSEVGGGKDERKTFRI